MRVLVVNAGASAVKLRLLGNGDELEASVDAAAGADGLVEEAAKLLDAGPLPDALGHRVVHGGDWFTSSVVLDDEAREGLALRARLWPVHNQPAMVGLEALLPNAGGC